MLKEKIYTDFRTAFKSRDNEAKTLLSTIKGEIQTQEKNTQVDDLSDEEVTKILLKFAKGIKQSLELNDNEASKEIGRNELSIVESYLPKQMSEEEVQSKLDEIIANGASNIGQVMGQFAKLNADKKLVSELARKALS